MSLYSGRFLQKSFVATAIIWIVLMPTIGVSIPLWLLLGSTMPLIPVLFHFTKNSAFDRFIGNLSYPIYCIHMLVWELVRTAIGRFHWSWELFPILTVTSSIVAGGIVYFFIDHFVERVRVRVALPQKVGKAGFAQIAVGSTASE
jgi:peptidoglycan/LPS O-acetylase OafA/YrhL